MTDLNLQKKIVKNAVVSLIIITSSTLLILLPIGITWFWRWVERIQNNANSLYDRGAGILLATIIILAYEFYYLVVWSSRYSTFKKINFPNEEIKTIYCKKVSSIKFFSVIGIKIRSENKTFVYISPQENTSLDTLKEKILHKTISLKCYQNTNIIKKINSKTITFKN